MYLLNTHTYTHTLVCVSVSMGVSWHLCRDQRATFGGSIFFFLVEVGSLFLLAVNSKLVGL